MNEIQISKTNFKAILMTVVSNKGSSDPKVSFRFSALRGQYQKEKAMVVVVIR